MIKIYDADDHSSVPALDLEVWLNYVLHCMALPKRPNNEN